jgi:hypothetical protein
LFEAGIWSVVAVAQISRSGSNLSS